ncbi:MAG: mechanosensitive ion channel family protein [Treponema sp.]|nr:mechanosensitive ion channel family protein [Treponema sp.]
MDNVVDAAQKATREISEQTGPMKDFLSRIFTEDNIYKFIGAIIMLLIFYGIYKLLIKIIKSVPEDKIKNVNKLIIKRIFSYAFYICCAMYILSLFGIKFTAIWGAAGIAGVALGFAAQTSVSNIISGLFVLSEKTMKVGDLITVGDITGIVDMINLLSVQIHTLDNQMVRIPNSTIINSNLINTTYFPNRRMTIAVSVDYNTDLENALKVLLKAPSLCPTVLSDPAPAAWIDSFADSGINLVLAVWFKKENFLETKNSTFIAINKVFNEGKIVIPYNRINICTVHDPQAESIASGELK